MKTKPHSSFIVHHSSFAFLAAFTLFTTAPRAPAQGDSVTVSAAEFQRMVYVERVSLARSGATTSVIGSM